MIPAIDSLVWFATPESVHMVRVTSTKGQFVHGFPADEKWQDEVSAHPSFVFADRESAFRCAIAYHEMRARDLSTLLAASAADLNNMGTRY